VKVSGLGGYYGNESFCFFVEHPSRLCLVGFGKFFLVGAWGCNKATAEVRKEFLKETRAHRA
jgi:hypothetical protein